MKYSFSGSTIEKMWRLNPSANLASETPFQLAIQSQKRVVVDLVKWRAG